MTGKPQNQASAFRIGTQHVALDAMQFAAMHWLEAIGLLQVSTPGFDESTKDAMRALDWNAAMQMLNEEYDAHVAAAKDTDSVKRKAIAESQVPRRLGEEEREFMPNHKHGIAARKLSATIGLATCRILFSPGDWVMVGDGAPFGWTSCHPITP